MGCTNCGSGEGGIPRGCRNNGTCSSGGCNKLNVFDWLSNMQLPNGKSQFDIVEIRFKNSRKSFFRNIKGLSLNVGDVVVVEASPGHDVGVVSVTGELARIQLHKKEPAFKANEARKIIRIASQADIDKWVASTKLEKETMSRSRTMALALSLNMKISDVEYQGDGTKATFYYTAEGRVDFRQLIKNMADTFNVRIEMRQIGARQESARLGGIGSCGRELCCSTWLTDFRSVSTKAARYQQLSLNPQKLAGQCGKLKCCLNFELDMYIEALKDFPSTEIKLRTKAGVGFHIKTDVFKKLMWYLCRNNEESTPSIIALSSDRVKEIIKLNNENKFPDDFDIFIEKEIVPEVSDYTKIVGQDALNRFDKKPVKKKRRKKKSIQKVKAEQNTDAGPLSDKKKEDVSPKSKPRANKGRPPKKQIRRKDNRDEK